MCIYVKDSINYKILYDLMVSKFEVLWMQIRPKRLPRGLTSIIVGTVYHPPSADVSPMLEFLYTSLSSIEAGFPGCGLILLGDFNKTLMQKTPSLCNAFNFHQIVNFPTRGDKTLDLIITNLKCFYAPPIKRRPPFGLSDHASIEVQPLDRSKRPKVKVFVKTRDLCQSKRLAIRSYLEQVDINALVDSKSTCKGKIEMLESIVKVGMDNILPLKSKSILTNDPPWINQRLKNLIHKRQRALAQDDHERFRVLRNQVNRQRKACRAKYEAKVEHLKECKPAVWWREVKNLGRMTAADSKNAGLASFLQHLDCGPDNPSPELVDIANTINQTFLAPMCAFTPLTAGDSIHPVQGSTYEVTELSVFKKLSGLNPSKSTGPDGIPGWLLKENADLLTLPVLDILNASFRESRLPPSWKEADIVPIPKQKPVIGVNKNLRPISLTPVLSKVAEDYVVEDFVKPAVLEKVDRRQFGTIPGTCTTHALVSMVHSWLCATDGNGATVRSK